MKLGKHHLRDIKNTKAVPDQSTATVEHHFGDEDATVNTHGRELHLSLSNVKVSHPLQQGRRTRSKNNQTEMVMMNMTADAVSSGSTAAVAAIQNYQ